MSGRKFSWWPRGVSNLLSATVNILGVEVLKSSFEDAVSTVLEWARQRNQGGPPRTVYPTNVHGLVHANRDASFKSILRGASMVLPDGLPLVWFGRLQRHPDMHQIRGPALTRAVLQRSGSGIRHFFYGGVPGVAEMLADVARSRYRADVAGWYTPPFTPLTGEHRHMIAEQVNRSACDILWVGLGTPKQELWIAEMAPALNCGVLISVGVAFDFITGRIREAPRVVRRVGVEWLWRLGHDPRRLVGRYSRNIPTFLVLAGAQLLGLRDFK